MHARRTCRVLAMRRVALAAAILWTAALFLAPAAFSLPAGTTGVRQAGAAVYVIGSALCHQRPERSLRVRGIVMPVCGRCLGLYVGGCAGLLLAGWIGPVEDRGRRVILAAAMPTVASLVLEWRGIAGITTAARLIAALPLGAAVGWLLGATIDGFDAGDRPSSSIV